MAAGDLASAATAQGLIGTLSNLFLEAPDSIQTGACSIMGLDESGAEVLPERSFQWWPEGIQDTITTGWTPIAIPGGSHPLQNWGNNGGRAFSFTVVLSRELLVPQDHPNLLNPAQLVSLLTSDIVSGLVDDKSERNAPYNVDVAAAVAYFRAYTAPRYNEPGVVGHKPPVIAALNFPNMQLNEDGRDVIYTVMTSCDVNYIRLFPNGRPKLAVLTLGFSQTVQGSDGVTWKGLDAYLGRQGDTGHPVNHYVRRAGGGALRAGAIRP